MSTIPASEIATVSPAVLAAGGSAFDVVGLMLTTSLRPPIGQVLRFPDEPSVSSYFGAGSAEALAAAIYFQGFDGASKIPGEVLFAQYNAAAVAAFLRGGNVSALTISQLQAITGTLIITVNGTQHTVAAVDLSADNSFSAAAATLQTLLVAASAPVTVAYDSVSGAFVITDTTTGATSTISYCTGTAAASLKLQAAQGAVTSQGADAAVPGTFMDALYAADSTWAAFMTVQNPDNSGNANKLAFAAWTSANNVAYVCWDTDTSPTTQVPATSSLGYLIAQASYGGTCLIYSLDNTIAAFTLGSAASINFQETNGRITFAFKSQAGIVADVTSSTVANNLAGNPQTSGRGNGYNFYGAYGAANAGFTWFQRGFVSGPYLWLDSFVDQIWLTRSFQLSALNFFKAVKSVPFTTAGYTQLEQALQDVIDAGLNFGAFAPGTISNSQAAAVNGQAGLAVSSALQNQGYYLQITPASSAVRAARGPLNGTFWYLDRGSVQSIDLGSIAVQ
jgi:hypothetical protein